MRTQPVSTLRLPGLILVWGLFRVQHELIQLYLRDVFRPVRVFNPRYWAYVHKASRMRIEKTRIESAFMCPIVETFQHAAVKMYSAEELESNQRAVGACLGWLPWKRRQESSV